MPAYDEEAQPSMVSSAKSVLREYYDQINRFRKQKGRGSEHLILNGSVNFKFEMEVRMQRGNKKILLELGHTDTPGARTFYRRLCV